jgi:hypothetical protein
MSEHEHAIDQVLSEIISMRTEVEEAASALRLSLDEVRQGAPPEKLKYDERYWTLVAHYDGMVRLRILIEQNFRFIETIGLLAVTRYIFELLV